MTDNIFDNFNLSSEHQGHNGPQDIFSDIDFQGSSSNLESRVQGKQPMDSSHESNANSPTLDNPAVFGGFDFQISSGLGQDHTLDPAVFGVSNIQTSSGLGQDDTFDSAILDLLNGIPYNDPQSHAGPSTLPTSQQQHHEEIPHNHDPPPVSGLQTLETIDLGNGSTSSILSVPSSQPSGNSHISGHGRGRGTHSHSRGPHSRSHGLRMSTLQRSLRWDYQSIDSAPHNYQSLLNLTICMFKKLYVTQSMFPELGNTALAEVHSKYQAQLAHQNAITSLNWKLTSLDIDYRQLGHFLSQECAPWRKFAIDVIRPRDSSPCNTTVQS